MLQISRLCYSSTTQGPFCSAKTLEILPLVLEVRICPGISSQDFHSFIVTISCDLSAPDLCTNQLLHYSGVRISVRVYVCVSPFYPHNSINLCRATSTSVLSVLPP